MSKILTAVFIFFAFLLGTFMGWVLQYETTPKCGNEVLGAFTNNINNYEGEWIHIRINDKMTYQEIRNTIEHEIHHKQIADSCGDDINICKRLQEQYDEMS